jgi:hypothetical protein
LAIGDVTTKVSGVDQETSLAVFYPPKTLHNLHGNQVAFSIFTAAIAK